IWFGGTGTLWIDDVSLRPGTHKPKSPGTHVAPVKGNRVYNSSFELDSAGWRYGKVVAGGHDSPSALAISANTTAEGRPFVVTPGQLYTVSLYARGPGARLRVVVTEAADNGGDRPVDRHHDAAEFALTDQWQRYSFRAVLEAPYTRGYMLRLRASGATAYVDDVQVEEGELTPWRPAAPVEIALDLAPLERYPLPRQPVEPEVRVWAPGRSGATVPVNLEWEDFFGQRAVAGKTTVQLDAAGRGKAKARCRGRDVGIYRLQARTSEGCSQGEIVIGVLPPDDGRREPASFFGTHANMNPDSDNVGVVLARRAGMRWYRLHDFNHHVQWRACEPEKKGQFSWADDEIEDLYRRGFELVGTLVRTPKWAGRDYPPDRPAIEQARVPRKLSWYADYVRAVVSRYKNIIHHWEMWNEPYGWGFWAGTPEEYAELERLGYRAAKQADPNCQVLGMCVYPGVKDWISRAAAAGGLQHLDVLTYHVYINPTMVEPRGDEGRSTLEEQVRYLRGLLREQGRREVPIWDSEGGVGCPSFYSWMAPDAYRYTWQQAASTVTKATAELMGSGVEKWFYYFIGFADGAWDGYYRMCNIAYVETDTDGSPKPTLLAHAAAARLLDRSAFVDRVGGERSIAYIFERDGRATAVLWARREAGDQPVNLALPRELASAEVLDLMGRRRGRGDRLSLTSTPVYLRAKMSGRRMRLLLRRVMGARK
ncbi:MAG: hypothetical protein J7M26_05165, partial [Armatimonadetes bacterium]|nr:hypothetical protein [Armatimonadota bacterium]